jgi:fimbrial chaperone protein
MRWSRQALFVLASMLCCLLTQAANLQISPVMINFRAGQGAAGINLQNYGETPLYGQVRVYAWDQRNGEDVLTPATEVVASPPIMEIGPKSSQTIRLVRRTAARGAGEQTYRVLIDEIPRGNGPENGVAIRLQYSVPLFVLPADDRATPVLTWTVLRNNGDWTLRVQNTGTLHAQLGATSVRTASGKEYELSKGLLGYALAGKTREWRLPVDKAAQLAGPLAIRAAVNAKAVTATAAVAHD